MCTLYLTLWTDFQDHRYWPTQMLFFYASKDFVFHSWQWRHIAQNRHLFFIRLLILIRCCLKNQHQRVHDVMWWTVLVSTSIGITPGVRNNRDGIKSCDEHPCWVLVLALFQGLESRRRHKTMWWTPLLNTGIGVIPGFRIKWNAQSHVMNTPVEYGYWCYSRV